MITKVRPYLATIIVTLLFVQFIAQPIRVSGPSMQPTLQNGQIGITSKMFNTSDLNRFDIVIINAEGKLIIKRVIGLPGENVSYKNSKLYVNDEYVEETFLDEDEITNDFNIHVPEGKYFCLGDNRDNSLDSRFYGAFSFSQIIAKGVFMLIPLKGIIN